MLFRNASDEKAAGFFEGLWQQGDYWQLESSEFERAKYDRQCELLGRRRYGHVLELGCGAGAFTRQIAPLADRILALDVSAAAIDRAREHGADVEHVEFRVANVMQFDPQAEGPWDLIVLSETIYYLGWLYSFFDVYWLAHQLYQATSPHGRLLMTNTYGGPTGYLLLPGIIRTYRDLMLNVQYTMEHEERFSGMKDGVALDVLISLFTKPGQAEDSE